MSMLRVIRFFCIFGGEIFVMYKGIVMDVILMFKFIKNWL